MNTIPCPNCKDFERPEWCFFCGGRGRVPSKPTKQVPFKSLRLGQVVVRESGEKLEVDLAPLPAVTKGYYVAELRSRRSFELERTSMHGDNLVCIEA